MPKWCKVRPGALAMLVVIASASAGCEKDPDAWQGSQKLLNVHAVTFTARGRGLLLVGPRAGGENQPNATAYYYLDLPTLSGRRLGYGQYSLGQALPCPFADWAAVPAYLNGDSPHSTRAGYILVNLVTGQVIGRRVIDDQTLFLPHAADKLPVRPGVSTDTQPSATATQPTSTAGQPHSTAGQPTSADTQPTPPAPPLSPSTDAPSTAAGPPGLSADRGDTLMRIWTLLADRPLTPSQADRVRNCSLRWLTRHSQADPPFRIETIEGQAFYILPSPDGRHRLVMRFCPPSGNHAKAADPDADGYAYGWLHDADTGRRYMLFYTSGATRFFDAMLAGPAWLVRQPVKWFGGP